VSAEAIRSARSREGWGGRIAWGTGHPGQPAPRSKYAQFPGWPSSPRLRWARACGLSRASDCERGDGPGSHHPRLGYENGYCQEGEHSSTERGMGLGDLGAPQVPLSHWRSPDPPLDAPGQNSARSLGYLGRPRAFPPRHIPFSSRGRVPGRPCCSAKAVLEGLPGDPSSPRALVFAARGAAPFRSGCALGDLHLDIRDLDF